MTKTSQRLFRWLSLVLLFLLGGASAVAQEKQTPWLEANPNPVLIRRGLTSGTVNLTWDGGKDHPYAELWVRVDQNDETKILERGRGGFQATVELGKSYVFKLSDSNKLLASVKVTAMRGNPNPVPTPDPAATPDYQPMNAVNGTIRWLKDYGVAPISQSLETSMSERCVSFYVAISDPRTGQPIPGEYRQMWSGDDFRDSAGRSYYTCRYTLKVPTNRQVRVFAGLGSEALLPNVDPNPLFSTTPWIGGVAAKSRPPAGSMRGFSGSKYVTLSQASPRATVDFEMIFAAPSSGNPK